MHILSVNRRTRLEPMQRSNGTTMLTGINKQPVAEAVLITPEGLEGDQIGDKKHHGGVYKAVYTYAGEHYDYWRPHLNRPDLPYGAFGENLTTHGLDEDTVNIGDQFQVGEAVIEATEPRQPCWTLGKHLQDPTMVKQLLQSGRMGIYFKVVRPGLVRAGDAIRKLLTHPAEVPVCEITRVYTQDKDDAPALRRLLAVDVLPPDWRTIFEKQLQKVTA